MENFETIRNELKYYIRNYAEEMLTKSKSKNQYECVFCGSGTGSHGTGALTIYENYFKCYSCGTVGDIFDLCEKVENVSKKQVVQHLSAKYQGIQPKSNQTTESTKTEKRKEVDYTEYYRECNRHLQDTDYHRGISLDTLNKFMIGYDAHWTPPDIPNAPATPRIIVPTSSTSYFARDTRNTDDIPDYQQKYIKQKQGDMHIFNENALKQISSPVFVVEGEFDALSVIDVGGKAIGLGSTSNINLFFSVIDSLDKYPTLIISLDNDKSGRDTTAKICHGLDKRKIEYHVFNISGKAKDPNEALMKDRFALYRIVENIIGYANDTEKYYDHSTLFQLIAEEEKEQQQPPKTEAEQIQPKREQESSENKYYNDYSADCIINSFWHTIQNTALNPIATGFKALDKSLNGGLIAGLYCIGAVSSLGKTTFALQIADNIAKNGKDVLIFSLEMSKNELIAKSISRCTSYTERPQTAIDVMNYKTQNTSNQAVISQAINEYHSTVSKNLFIREGQGKTTAKDIHEQAEKHLENRGSAPVIILDYLQILSPIDDRATDKQNIDTAILTLKQLSRDLNTPVIVINSFNRDSYDKTVAEKSFKESGAIEYSSDVLIGLQLQKIGKLDITALKRQDIRKVELIILKNRNGVVGDKINFDFKAKYNVFTDKTAEIQDKTEKTVNSNITKL